MKNLLLGHQKEDSRPLRIGILNGLLKNWFTPYLNHYCKEHQRKLSIHIEDQIDLKVGIESGRYDITFSTENLQSELVTSLKIFDKKLVLISKEEIVIQNFEQYRWIVFSEGDNLYRLSKKESKELVTVDSIHTILNLVSNGLGIAVVPDHVLKKNEELCIYDFPTLGKSEIFMTTLNYKQMPIHIKELADLIERS